MHFSVKKCSPKDPLPSKDIEKDKRFPGAPLQSKIVYSELQVCGLLLSQPSLRRIQHPTHTGGGGGGGSVSCWDKQKTVRLNMGGDAADLIMNDFAK